jgi:hypothetical protein
MSLVIETKFAAGSHACGSIWQEQALQFSTQPWQFQSSILIPAISTADQSEWG